MKNWIKIKNNQNQLTTNEIFKYGASHGFLRAVLFALIYYITTNSDDEWSGGEAVTSFFSPDIIITAIMVRFFKINWRLPVFASMLGTFTPNAVPNLIFIGYNTPPWKKDKNPLYFVSGLIISSFVYTVLYGFLNNVI